MELVLFLVGLAITLAFHECAHAWAADRFGDPTPRYQGRLTLNPLAHIDFVGTLMLFFFHFGWGKPVQINPANFRHPVRDSALTALAGPAANFLLAFIVSLPLQYFSNVTDPTQGVIIAQRFFSDLLDLNIALGIFNFLPFPPLDGSKIFGLIVPRRYGHVYGRFLENGMTYFILFIGFDIFILGHIFGFSIVGTVVGYLVEVVRTVILLGNDVR